MAEFTDKTAGDALLAAWVGAHYGNEVRVIVSHVTREVATMRPGDLTNTQYRLADGRLVLVHWQSPRKSSGQLGTSFIFAEAPKAEG